MTLELAFLSEQAALREDAAREVEAQMLQERTPEEVEQDKETCMCGASISPRWGCDGHNSVSVWDYELDRRVERLRGRE